MRRKKQCLANINRNTNLQFICCEAIANDGKIELLAAIADILPISIVKYFIATCKTIELSKFHSFCPKGANVEKLLLERYKKMCNQMSKAIRWHEFRKRSKLEFYSKKFWTCRLSSCMKNNKQYNRLVKAVKNLPHHIKRLELRNDPLSGPFHAAALQVYSESTINVRCLSLIVNGYTNFERMLALAKNLKCLKKLKIAGYYTNSALLLSLKAFLEYKVRKNEKVILSFVNLRWGNKRKLLIDLFTQLGNAIHGIAGLAFDYETRDTNHRHREALTVYSEVECMKEFKVRRAIGISECLLNIISHAPPCKSEHHALSKLHLDEIKLFPENFAAFSHWRFSRLKHFHMSNINVGYEGAHLLALHASFWPFVKRFILRNCQIPSSGFSLLLPAMIQGKGCENLAQLDFSDNTCLTDSFPSISMFLSSTNLTKLKTVRFFSIDDTHMIHALPLPLLKGMEQLPLAYLDMRQICLPLEQVYKILYCLLSKPNHQLLSITMCFQVCCTEKFKDVQLEFQQRLNRRGICCVPPSILTLRGNAIRFQRSDVFSNFSSHCIS